MIDTLNWRLDATQFDRAHMLKIMQTKCDPRPTYAFTEYKTISVNHKNYRFTLSDSYFTAIGSLTKLHYGNNIQQLTYGQILEQLRYFEQFFEMSIDDAKIIRVDMACNLEVEKSVPQYLDLFPTPEGYKGVIYENETKYFNKCKETIVWYDKALEMKARGKQLGANYSDKNILRYEIRILKDIADGLNWADSTIKNLYDFNDYLSLLNKFLLSYKSLPVFTTPLPSHYNFNNVTDFKDSLAVDSIRARGGIQRVELALKDKTIKRESRYAIRKFLGLLPEGVVLSPILKQELDDKMQAVYDYEKQQALYWL